MSVYLNLNRHIAARDLVLAEKLIDALINPVGSALGARAMDLGMDVRRWVRFVYTAEFDEVLDCVFDHDAVAERNAVRERGGVLTPLSENERWRLRRGTGRLIRFNGKERRVVTEDLAAIDSALERAARLLPRRKDEIGQARRAVVKLRRMAA